jgi:hypothetical protein
MRFERFFLALGLALPVQCIAAQSAPLDITEARNAAVGYALTASAGTERMVKACSTVPSVAQSFSDAQYHWVERNRPYVEAANAWMSYVESLLTQQKGAEVARAFVANTYGVFSDQASLLAAEAVPGSPPQAEACSKWARILESGAFDLLANSEFKQDLQEIRSFHDSFGHGDGR